MEKPLWQPSPQRVAAANLTRFMEKAGPAGRSYDELHRWSVENREAFWTAIWDFGGVVGERGPRALADGDKMPGAIFFPDARLNFAENLLARPGTGDAIVFW